MRRGEAMPVTSSARFGVSATIGRGKCDIESVSTVAVAAPANNH
jgi:hypothetical protein